MATRKGGTAVGRKRDRADRLHVSREGAQLATSGYVPQLEGVEAGNDAAAARKSGAGVRRERDRVDTLSVPGEGAQRAVVEKPPNRPARLEYHMRRIGNSTNHRSAARTVGRALQQCPPRQAAQTTQLLLPRLGIGGVRAGRPGTQEGLNRRPIGA